MSRASILFSFLLAGCASVPRTHARVEEPLVLGEVLAYEAATWVVLPETVPASYPGLHNVFQLSDTVYSGGEPEDQAALERIASWGVKTILSVDGKIPDADAAEEFGMHYVHIPIQYSGVAPDEVARITKTFRELPGPFFVHCFHGRHRGPAAAALGRLVLDGASREQAIAEMRQWCSTSSKYEGLYRTIATADLPSQAETEAFEFDFASAHQLDGARAVMIELARTWDLVKASSKRGWAADPDHPDVDALQEAIQLEQLYAALVSVEAEAEDYRTYVAEGYAGSKALVAALRAGDDAAGAFDAVGASCSDCHVDYRNR